MGVLTQDLARITPHDLLANAPLWALVIWTRPHVNDIGVATVGGLSPGATVPHVQSPARRCNVVATFFEEDAANAALDLTTETIATLLLFGSPATQNIDGSQLAGLNVQGLKNTLMLDLRELMGQGQEEHIKRLRGAVDDALLNREHRVIDLDGDSGDPPPAPLEFPEAQAGHAATSFEELTAASQASLLAGMGVPADVITGNHEDVDSAAVRASLDEMARRSQRPPRDPRDGRG